MRYPRYKRPIQEINGNLYLISAEYPSDKIKNINLVKEWLEVDNAFRSHRSNTILFCDLIQEVTWVDIT